MIKVLAWLSTTVDHLIAITSHESRLAWWKRFVCCHTSESVSGCCAQGKGIRICTATSEQTVVNLCFINTSCLSRLSWSPCQHTLWSQSNSLTTCWETNHNWSLWLTVSKKEKLCWLVTLVQKGILMMQSHGTLWAFVHHFEQWMKVWQMTSVIMKSPSWHLSFADLNIKSN